METPANGIAGQIVFSMSQLIIAALTARENERTHPGFDPDKMDDTIKFYGERATKLRELREQFENEMARVAPY